MGSAESDAEGALSIAAAPARTLATLLPISLGAIGSVRGPGAADDGTATAVLASNVSLHAPLLKRYLLTCTFRL